jgi:hypothetical protein
MIYLGLVFVVAGVALGVVLSSGAGAATIGAGVTSGA